jgi:hypothetical protein
MLGLFTGRAVPLQTTAARGPGRFVSCRFAGCQLPATAHFESLSPRSRSRQVKSQGILDSLTKVG